MKIYKIDDNVFIEVIDDPESYEDRNGYKVRVNRHTFPKSPIFKYKDETFLELSMYAWNNKVEVTEEEFRSELDNILKASWIAMFELERSSGDKPFILSPLAVATREAYKKTYNVDHMEFLSAMYKTREEYFNGK